MSLEYLDKVLAAEGSHIPNINTKILDLISHTDALKSEVRTVVEESSIQFNPLLRENEQLKSRADDLLKKMSLVEEEIEVEIKEELAECSEELETLSFSLKEVNMFLMILKKLLEINSTLNQARKKLEAQEFYECTEFITKAQDLVKSNSEKLKLIEVFKVLSQEVVLTYEQLMHEISEILSQNVNINIEKLPNGCTKIIFSINIKNKSKITQIIKASNLLPSSVIIKKCSNLIFTNVLNTVIKKKVKLNVEINDEAILFIEVFNDEEKPKYVEVFENIRTVVEFLKSHLDFEISDEQNFLSKIGVHISDDFAQSLIKNCLSETIPTNSEDLKKYKDVVESVGVLEKLLHETGFLPKNCSSVLDYAKNINVLFANKFCQAYLEKARTIMKKDLHNVTKSQDVVSNISILPVKDRNHLRDAMNIQEEIFTFSKCQISKQAEELVNLTVAMMNEIQKSVDLCAVRLFYTIRNIFEMYCAVVPLHHKKFLETLPQQVALFHNNCMYFAHNLINLATEFYNKIPTILKDHFMILLEEAVVLRSLAAETLEVTVTNQRSQLIYILRESGFAALNEDPKLDPNAEKSLRQCIRQLQILQTVWSDVLPVNVYNRAMAFLLDAVVEELVNLIISVEDISSQTASDLVSIFKILLERGPILFPVPKEIHRHSKNWQKFKEFVLILEGSLRDIDDRWANGMGPLAIEFTPEQVKHLIRALFQNSKRRADLLARIR